MSKCVIQQTISEVIFSGMHIIETNSSCWNVEANYKEGKKCRIHNICAIEWELKCVCVFFSFQKKKKSILRFLLHAKIGF